MNRWVRDSDLLTSTEPGISLFISVTLTIKLERLEEYLAALREVVPAARAEPSCIYLHVGQSMTGPGVFVLSEEWKDRVEYRDAILQKPYFQAYMQISESTYAQPRRVVLLTPAELGLP
ncbi:MAG: putative quinol monooxygenase [Trebonia sp.]